MRRTSIYPLLFACLFMTACGTAKKLADTQTQQFRYEMECAGNGVQGTYLVKVWSFSNRIDVALEQCRKNAVHGVIFKGYTGRDGCVSQRPIASTPGVEMEHREFFDSFFADGGEWQKYVTLTEGTQEVIDLGKEYKVGVVVSVAKDDLRRALEAAGVIRSLSAGF